MAFIVVITWRFDRYLFIRPRAPVLPAEKTIDSVEVLNVFSGSSQVTADAVLTGVARLGALSLNGELLLDKKLWRFSIWPIDESQSAAFGFSQAGQSKLRAYEKANGHLPEAWLQFNLIKKSTAAYGYSIVKTNGCFVHLSDHHLNWSIKLAIPDAQGEYLLYCQLASREQWYQAVPNLRSSTDGYMFARRVLIQQ